MEADNDNPSAAESISAENSPGKLLQELREAAGLTRAYMAEQMRVNEVYITFLENDEFTKLPSEPYIIGYYRTCSRILNITPDQLISRYRQQHSDASASGGVGTGTSPGHSSFPRKPMRLNQNTKLEGKAKTLFSPIYVLVALVLVAIWVGVSLLSDQTDQAVSVGAEGAAVQLSMPNSGQDLSVENEVVEGDVGSAVESTLENENRDVVTEDTVTDGAAIEGSATETDITSIEPALTRNDEAELQAATPVEEVAEKVVRPLDQLAFAFTDECWLEVTDANGDVLAATLYQNGDTAQLSGIAPFDVMMGNARATQLQLNGEAVKLTPQSNRKTLRLRVGRPAAVETE